MAEGRNRAAWSRTATILAMLANCNRDPKKTGPCSPDDYNPYGRGDRGGADIIEIGGHNVDIMRRAFMGEKS